MALVPLFLVTGFLGAGKTRLFQRIAPFAPFDHALILVNEFGQTSIDDALMINRRGQARALAGGCVCCSSRHELLTTIQMALADDAPPNAILIETTGLASPQPILAALQGNAALAQLLDVRIITVIDGLTALATLQSQPMAEAQLALADGIVLTKTDLMADASQIAALDKHLAMLNPLASLVHGALQRDEALAAWMASLGHHALTAPMENHVDHIGTVRSIVLKAAAPMPLPVLEAFLFAAVQKLGPQLLRLKGFVAIASPNAAPRLALVHIVQGVLSPPEWQAEPEGQTMQIVAIADGAVLEDLERLFQGIVLGAALDMADAQALNDNPLSIAGFRP